MKVIFSLPYATNYRNNVCRLFKSLVDLSSAITQYDMTMAQQNPAVSSRNGDCDKSKETINKTLKLNILVCYVTDPLDMLLKCYHVLLNRICPIFLLNILLSYVIDSPNLPITPFPILCVRFIEYAC